MPENQGSGQISPQPANGRYAHNHAVFVLDWITIYRFRFYRDRVVHQGKIGASIESWDPDDQKLAIEEGRRQIDDQFAQLQHVTTRASVLLTVGLVVIGFLLNEIDEITMTNPSWKMVHHLDHSTGITGTGFLLAGTAMAFWGTLIMGALIAGRSHFQRTDAIQITNQPGPLLAYLARDYAESIRTGENTNAARLSHLGTGLRWIVSGALAGVLAEIVKVWFS